MVFLLMLLIIILTILCSYLHYRQCNTYWEKKGVPTRPKRFPAGDLTSVLLRKESFYVCMEKCFEYFRNQGYIHGGLYLFNNPIYFPIDPHIIKSILITDFQYFADRGVYMDFKRLPLAKNLFGLSGDEWKAMRSKMTPAFSIGKLKVLYQSCINIAEELLQVVDMQSEVDCKEISMRYTVDIIGNICLGLNCYSLKNPLNNRCFEYISKTMEPPHWFDILRVLLRKGLKNPGDFFEVAYNNKDVEDFFRQLTRDIEQKRNDKTVIRDDLVQHLLIAKNQLGLSFDDLMAQTFMIFLAGVETSSSTMAFLLHELAHNQNIQDQLRDEILKQLGTDVRKFDYETLTNLPYLEKVVAGNFFN